MIKFSCLIVFVFLGAFAALREKAFWFFPLCPLWLNYLIPFFLLGIKQWHFGIHRLAFFQCGIYQATIRYAASFGNDGNAITVLQWELFDEAPASLSHVALFKHFSTPVC